MMMEREAANMPPTPMADRDLGVGDLGGGGAAHLALCCAARPCGWHDWGSQMSSAASAIAEASTRIAL
jgi:hypothetical protein